MFECVVHHKKLENSGGGHNLFPKEITTRLSLKIVENLNIDQHLFLFFFGGGGGICTFVEP